MHDYSIACPQPICYSCSNLRCWADKPVHNEKGHLIGWEHFCAHYPDGVPSKCVNLKDYALGDEAKREICPHFKRGAPQQRKPPKTA